MLSTHQNSYICDEVIQFFLKQPILGVCTVQCTLCSYISESLTFHYTTALLVYILIVIVVPLAEFHSVVPTFLFHVNFLLLLNEIHGN